MTEFQRALDQYLEGGLDDHSLDTALQKTLIAAPGAAGEVERTVRDLRSDNRITQRLYSTLMTRVRGHGTQIIAEQPGPAPATKGAAAATTVAPAQPLQPGDPMIGAVFRERFILESEIGHGGMGIVYCARDLRREETGDRHNKVAIKVLAGSIRDDPDAYVALQREAKRAQQLAHPNIATVYDFDREGDTAYLCMELLRGQPLDQFLATTAAQGLSFEKALPMIKGMASGLSYAHERGIVHADFKPNNVFLTDKGVVKILDFGIARVVSQPDRTALTVFDAGRLGAMTPSYASCEMFERRDPDPRDDIYALACVTYELLTGSHPFSSLAAPQARAGKLEPGPIAGLSTRQNRALRHALAFAREDRTPSVEGFLEELTQPRNPAPGWIVGGIGAAALLVAAGTAAWLFLFGGAPGSVTPPEAVKETVPPGESVKETAAAAEPAKETTPAAEPAKEAVSPAEPGSGSNAGTGGTEPQTPQAGASVATANPSPKPVDDATRAKINRILNIAKLGLASGHLVEPPGSNAAEAFAAVAGLQPGNREAREGLEAVANAIVERASELVRKKANGEALDMVKKGLKWVPDNPGLIRLRDELESP